MADEALRNLTKLKRNEMAKISKYTTDSTVAAGDRVLGTDGLTGFTKNYTISDIGSFIDATYDTDTTYSAGSGLDLSTTTFSVDVSDFLTNGVNNRVVTATGTDAMNSEANLTFDGSTLAVTGHVTISNGVEITGAHLYNSDGVKVFLGDDSDFSIYHQPGTASIDGGTTSVGSWIVSDSGNLLIHQSSPDQDIIFVNDNGSGGNATYMTLDGGAKTVDISVPLNVTTDADVTGSVKCTQNLRRTVTTASESSGTHTITLVDNDNFNIAVTNAATTIALVVATENIGQSGMITITNPASVGSLSFVALPSYMLTPEGATINFVTTANAVSIISYYVLATDKVLVNYVGNFA